MKPSNTISFHFLYDRFSFRDRKKVKRFLLDLFKKEGKVIAHISYIFCDDAYLLEINQSYLQHDTFTDIITFDLSEEKNQLISDIYISIERVKENSKAFTTSFESELLRVIFHGALHLCGYKDKTKADQMKMRQMEDYYLQQFFVSRETL